MCLGFFQNFRTKNQKKKKSYEKELILKPEPLMKNVQGT